jgi:hypothetical protein
MFDYAKFSSPVSPVNIAGHCFKNRILCAPMLFAFYALRTGSTG